MPEFRLENGRQSLSAYRANPQAVSTLSIDEQDLRHSCLCERPFLHVRYVGREPCHAYMLRAIPRHGVRKSILIASDEVLTEVGDLYTLEEGVHMYRNAGDVMHLDRIGEWSYGRVHERIEFLGMQAPCRDSNIIDPLSIALAQR
ncbi:hypothetical protein GF342_06065 [Candidatus Woesearchaeota archaeon]|nr:hypothetical protein [Candidatus Woesearchaeota archaeon]